MGERIQINNTDRQTHAQAHTRAHVHTRTHTWANEFQSMIYTHTHLCPHTHTLSLSRTHGLTNSDQRYTHTHTHTHTHPYIQKHTQSYIYMYGSAECSLRNISFIEALFHSWGSPPTWNPPSGALPDDISKTATARWPRACWCCLRNVSSRGVRTHSSP